jgi:hypothetical protein
MSREPPVELFVPPEVVSRPPSMKAGPRSVRSPGSPAGASLGVVPGMAAVDHSGRVRDALVVAALGWAPGERTEVRERTGALLVCRVAVGGAVIDARGRVFLPVAARAQLGIAVGERSLLVAVPERDLLVVHRVSVMAGLLAAHYADRDVGDAGLFDDRP